MEPESPPVLPAAPPRRRINPEMWTAASAVVIGVCALLVSIYQARLMHEQQELMQQEQRATVWPYLDLGTSYSGDALRLMVFNNGVGPARVQGVSASFEGRPLASWSDLLAEVMGGDGYRFTMSHLSGRVLPAEQHLEYEA